MANQSEFAHQPINQRLKFLIKSLGLTVRAFSAALDVPESSTRNYLDKGTKLNSEYLEKIAHHFSQVNLNWLITGLGEQFVGDPPSGTMQIGKSNQAGTGNKQKNVEGSQGNTAHESQANAALESANKEIAMLREQLAMKDQLIAAKEEMLVLLRSQFNRPN